VRFCLLRQRSSARSYCFVLQKTKGFLCKTVLTAGHHLHFVDITEQNMLNFFKGVADAD
jgi:hypothetical protein